VKTGTARILYGEPKRIRYGSPQQDPKPSTVEGLGERLPEFIVTVENETEK